MTTTIGTNYVVTVPTLSDQASIIDAFKYYHIGTTSGGTPQPNSLEYHLVATDTRLDSIETAIGWPYSSGSNISSRILALESTSENIAGTYIKASPSTNIDAETRNIITPANTTTIPLAIQGSNGQSVDLQRWFVYGDSTPRARISNSGRIYSYDGSSVDEVATLSGTQTLSNKSISMGVNTVSSTSYSLISTDRGKIINMTSTSAKSVTVPTNATASIPIGTQIMITNLAATGSLTIQAASGVTVYSQDNRAIIFPYGTAYLLKVNTDIWTLNFMSKERTTFIQTTEPPSANDGDIWLKYG